MTNMMPSSADRATSTEGESDSGQLTASTIEGANQKLGSKVALNPSALVGDSSDGSQSGQQGGAFKSSSSGGSSNSLLNGHYDPRQRFIYLVLFGSSVAFALIGLVLLFTWMLHLRPVTGIGFGSSSELTNLHPILMYIFLVSLNMYAVLTYRTHFYLAKSSLKWIHGSMLGVSMLAAWVGVYAIWKAHQIDGRADFFSLHSWIGVLTNALFFLQFLAGFLAFALPNVIAQHQRALIMPFHRLSGTLILVFASLAAVTGMAEMAIFQGMSEYTQFQAITFVANFAAICVIFMAAIAVYLLSSKRYLRPLNAHRHPDQLVKE